MLLGLKYNFLLVIFRPLIACLSIPNALHNLWIQYKYILNVYWILNNSNKI